MDTFLTFVEALSNRNLAKCADTIKSLSVFLSFAKRMDELEVIEFVVIQLKTLRLLCREKFPLLVTVDISGTLLLRESKEKFPYRGDISIKHTTCFFRPGYKEFLLKLYQHPRIKLVFYATMLEKNMMRILNLMLVDELSPIRKDLKIVFG
jgi:hypothetical protein